MNDDKTLTERMFDQIGDKIKTLATVFCWLGIIASVIIALIMFGNSTESYSESESYLTLGFIWLIVGPLASYCISLLMYGFGELIEKTTDIEKTICLNNKKSTNIPETEWTCPNCNKSNRDIYNTCQHCGTYKPCHATNIPTASSDDSVCPHCGEKIRKGQPFCSNCKKFINISTTDTVSTDYIKQAKDAARKAVNKAKDYIDSKKQ